MENTLERNKAVVIRFNKEFIEQGNAACFTDLVSDELVNHAAPGAGALGAAAPGAPSGPESMIYFLHDVLRVGFPDITVNILDQVAENDKVTTRKEFHGTHTGEFMGIPASNKKVVIKVIDIIRLRDGKYVEHWGMSNLAEVMQQIAG
ncbi:MAG: ester cyclase [Dyadobacter sp.]|uniref:ester cyclase n=1 Tax=Dyadobacter sp. TaxID=1914288 RepID=UPI003263E7F4